MVLAHLKGKELCLQAYIGPPGVEARYQILHSCVVELQRTGIVAPDTTVPTWKRLPDSVHQGTFDMEQAFAASACIDATQTLSTPLQAQLPDGNIGASQCNAPCAMDTEAADCCKDRDQQSSTRCGCMLRWEFQA